MLAGGAEAPWIESALCTTCNECTNINPQMFKYNGDKQATIADASKGTFLQLVKAAESANPHLDGDDHHG